MDIQPSCVKLSVQPSRGLMDEKFVVLVQNATPGFQLTVHALHQCEDGHSWEAFAHYTANATGTVNVSEDPSLGGTYSGVEQMGLLWSLRPVPGSKPGLRLRKMNVQTPMEERDHSLACWIFGGGGMNLLESRAALLASHGIASLTLNYLAPKITVENGKVVDNDYFERAYRVLEQHPQVLSSRIAMLGLSLGTTITLKMAVYSQVVKLRCAVCISGTHVQPVNGSLEEMYTFCQKHAWKTRVSEENQVIWRDLLLPITTDPKYKVDMGRIECPLLLVVGEDDQNWPAKESTQDIKEMMERAGNSHLLTILSYPNAGHLIEPPYTPHVRASTFRTACAHQEDFTLVQNLRTVNHSFRPPVQKSKKRNQEEMGKQEELRNEVSALQRYIETLRRQNDELCQHRQEICQYNQVLCEKVQALHQSNKDLHQQMEDLNADNRANLNVVCQQRDALQREVRKLKKKLQREKSQRLEDKLEAEETEQALNVTVLTMYNTVTSKLEEVEVLHGKLWAAIAKNCEDVGVILRKVADIYNAKKEERQKRKNSRWFHLWLWFVEECEASSSAASDSDVRHRNLHRPKPADSVFVGGCPPWLTGTPWSGLSRRRHTETVTAAT
ncbi:hypothetical protein L3Q82_007142 [Scortum barcoo]|uniref:Uncharacterized protein n=1 Tax=Scortum barcoo TaxID=214431 RepID=A0ACB8WT17_9TELE|nr:hypothetical protein L3Q82_007142 [Scortum barcoo]